MDSESGHPKLIRTNYHSWRLDAEVQLTGLGALGIVEGTEPVPEVPSTSRAAELTNYSQNAKDYRQAREKAIQWIWNHIHSDFHSIVAAVRRDPRAMWLELERRLGGRDNYNIWAVRQQLGSESFKENDTIQTWSARLDTYNQRLIGTGSELSELERIAKLLSTLPKRFEITVSHIQRIPNLDYQTALQQLLDFENQLPVGAANGSGMALITEDRPRRPFQLRRGRGSRYRPSDPYRREHRVENPRPTVYCYHCGRRGHTKSKCWELQRRAEEDKQNQARLSRIPRGTNYTAEDAATSSTNPTQQPPRSDANYMEDGFAHMASHDASSTNEWILDSGASHTMTHTRSNLTHFKRFHQPRQVIIGDGSHVKALGSGTLHIRTNLASIDLKEVWWVPHLSTNLISVRSLDDMGLEVIFAGGQCRIQRDGRSLATASQIRSNLYQLNLPASAFNAKFNNYHPITIWHQRLGHLNLKDVSKITRIQLPKQLSRCASCMAGKQHAVFNRNPQERATKPFEFIHSDLSGLLPTSLGGYRYFLVFVDDFTRYTHTYFLKGKSMTETIEAFRAYHTWIKTQFGAIVRRIRTDNGTGEFANQYWHDYMINEGIQHEFSPPNTPHMNGVSERTIRTLKEMARTMLAGANLPDREEFWGEAVATATYIRNLSPSRAFNGKVPLIGLYPNLTPRYNHLKPFGCLAYVLVPPAQRSTWQSRTRRCLFMGYIHNTTKVWKVYDIEAKRTFNTGQVIFDEEQFPGIPIESQNLQCHPSWQVEGPHAVANIVQSSFRDLHLEVIKQESELLNFKICGIEPPQDYHLCDPIIPPRATALTAQRSREDLSKGGAELSAVKKPAGRLRVDVAGDPLDYHTAMQVDPVNWSRAIRDEFSAHQKNQTYEIIPLPLDKTAIGCKWVFKTKYNAQGDMHFKARLVAKGYEQEYGVHYQETYAPVARLTSMRLLLALAAWFQWEVEQLDVVTAFLNPHLSEEIYMEPPEGMELEVGKVLRLNRTLYGLKQSPYEWYSDMHKKLMTLGFRRSTEDPNIYVSTLVQCILLLYVDDILLAGPQGPVSQIKQDLMKLYRMKDLGKVSLFLGMQIERDSHRIRIHQKRYIDKLLERFNMSSSHGITTPLSIKNDLHEARDNDKILDYDDRKQYQAIVGGLMYLMTATRPDLAFTLSRLSKFNAKPTTKHIEAAKHALRYIKYTSDMGLVYGGRDTELYGYTDSDFAADVDNRKSTSGYVFLLNGACVHWQSKQQSLLARSTHQAEYVAMANASYETSYLRRLIADIHPDCHPTHPTTLYADNQSAIITAQSGRDVSPRSKHIDIRYHITREALSNGILRLEYIRTTEMTADILTKALPRELHEKHILSMGLRKGFA